MCISYSGINSRLFISIPSHLFCGTLIFYNLIINKEMINNAVKYNQEVNTKNDIGNGSYQIAFFYLFAPFC